jgi:hypothetical protein
MILSIPYQALEIGNIHLTPFQADKYGKAVAQLSYKDNSIDFHDVSILSPPVKVIDYNSENSRLRVNLSDQFNFQVKLSTLQEYLISTFYVHQQSFLNNRGEDRKTIGELFHFLLEGSTLSLYVFPSSYVKKIDGTTSRVSDLTEGDTIRFIIRLQGISQVRNKYGFRLRVQHSVPSIWHINEKLQKLLTH